jgi:hypothetical protein
MFNLSIKIVSPAGENLIGGWAVIMTLAMLSCFEAADIRNKEDNSYQHQRFHGGETGFVIGDSFRLHQHSESPESSAVFRADGDKIRIPGVQLITRSH